MGGRALLPGRGFRDRRRGRRRSRPAAEGPAEGEPVIPGNTTLLVPVMGIDGMGRPLEEETVFRSAIASRLLEMPVGSIVAEEVIARLMVELIRCAPPGSRVVPLINKVDIPGGREKAKRLARHIFSLDQRGIRRVVLGRLQPAPEVDVIAPG